MEETYFEQLKSPIADMKNTGGRWVCVVGRVGAAATCLLTFPWCLELAKPSEGSFSLSHHRFGGSITASLFLKQVSPPCLATP